uniref:Uncharacterized protein n=1 Tax=Anguilla anguilla TaxID=7936 RepID=A0A0E9W0Z4_ANGAN
MLNECNEEMAYIRNSPAFQAAINERQVICDR